MPRLLAGATSDRYNGVTTVSPPAPRPPQIRANNKNPYIPDANACIKKPLMYTSVRACQLLNRPIRSVMASASREPKQAPRTPREVISAFLLARPEASSVH